MSHIYFSQCGEDQWLVENGKVPAIGKFCEVGCDDGISSSNTLCFERMGWTGILVEADPKCVEQCRANRTSPVIAAAAWRCNSLRKFKVNDECPALSGLTRPGREIWVTTLTLETILEMTQFSDLDLLSIDTEGTELETIISIGRIKPRIVIMEYVTMDEPPNDIAIGRHMALQGYREIHRTKFNLIYQYTK